VTEEFLASLFSDPYEPLEFDFSSRSRGQVWFKYISVEVAHEVLLKMHQQQVKGVSLIVRFELGVDSNGRRLVDRNSHHTIVRSIQLRRGREKDSKTSGSASGGVSYTHRSLFCGEMEYPFPTGLYLTRVIQLTNLYPPHDPLLRILRDTSFFGNKYSKEISECMAMADCVQRAVRMVAGDCCSVYDSRNLTTETSTPSDVVVYVLGDGVRPLCAAAVCLHVPRHYNWRYVSIDPLMRTDDLELGVYGSCLEVVRGYSQDYGLPPSHAPASLSLVIACHSHAPLAEFWNRVSSPKIAITMACCADYAELPDLEPIFRFSDYEVYSPKREVQIYSSGCELLKAHR
jgi:hypothetical protein